MQVSEGGGERDRADCDLGVGGLGGEDPHGRVALAVGGIRCRGVRVMLGALPVPEQPYSVEDLQAGVRQPQPGDPGFVGSLVDYHHPKCMDWCELVHWEPALTPS